MKRDFLKMIAFVAMLFLPFALFAQFMDPAYGIRIDESFEKGIPADWKQENVSGQVNWVVESQNLTYPNGAADSLARVAFRNTSGVTNKAVTRLVLPPVEVASLFQPILVFSHAQDKWSGDFDSLRVLCRTSADGEWKTLTAYDNYIARWQRDTIFLPSASYCQIAFEAADNLGRGVVIDDVIIRSTPSCFNPEDLYTSNVTNNSITVNWMGSFDAEYFYVKLSKDTLSAAELESSATELVCDTTTDGVSMDFEGLTQGTKYYCYVRSQCEHEISGWASIEFKTANIFNIPDTITFDLPADDSKKGQFAYMDGWYYAASSPEYKPYVNAYGTDWKYGGSYNGTASMVFTYYLSSGAVSPQCYMGALPAGTWAYAATPEINGNIKDLQISFESFVYYRYVADQFGIIVGVMTDPEDRSTFVPVKTIINDRPFIYEDFTVTFEDYTGDGKYIAFMSDFSKSNHFTIENLIIEPRDEKENVQFDIMMPTASTMKFDFEQTFDSYEIILTPSEYTIDRDSDFPDTLSYYSKHNISDLGSIEDLTPDSRYYVYVRGVKGDKKGRWNYPRYVEMPSRLDYNTLPYVMDFENISKVSLDINGYSSSSITLPKVIKPLCTYLSSTFKLVDSLDWAGASYRMAEPISKTDFQIGCYWPYKATTIAVFPEVDMSKTKVSFYAVGRMSSKSLDPNSASNQNNYKSKAAIGIMTDANDINSFIAIDTIEPSFEEYTYYEYDFSLYPEAKGNFFAIKVNEFEYTHTSVTSYTNKIHVDNVTFAKSVDCKSPSEIAAEVDVNDPSKATITWAANGVTEWNVKVATTEYDKNQFGINEDFEFAFEGKVTEPKAVVTGLQYPNQTYYYWLQPVCGGVAAEWTMPNSFETFCPAVHSVPYTQDFDDVTAIGSNVWDGFAVECMITKQWTRNIPNATSNYKNKYYYPYVTNSVAYNGENSLPVCKKYNSSSRYYVALPQLDKPIDSLQITFRLYSLKNSSTYWNAQELAVGVMTDPMDISTFEQVALVKPSKEKTWERILVKFDDYTGNGKHIAIRETDKYTSAPSNTSKYAEGLNTDSVYIDNIEVNIAAPCDIPYDIYASDVTPNSAQLNWKSDANEFISIVTDKALAFTDLIDLDDYVAGNLPNFAHAASIISVDTIVGAKNYKLTELTINKEYYVYMKSFCSGIYTDYSDAYTFSTYCPATSPETFFANFTDDTSGQIPDCWFAGKTSGVYQSTNTLVNYVKVVSLSNYGQVLLLSSTNGAVLTTGQPNINGTYIVTPSMDIDNINKYKVMFKAFTTTSYMFTGSGSNDYARSVIVGVVTNPYDMSTFTPIETIENIHYSPYPYEVYFDKYVCDLNGDTGKFVAFYSNFDVRNNIYLDDISLELIDSCPRFKGHVEGTTPSSVTIKFDEAPASYEVKVSTSATTTNNDFNNDTLNTYPSEVGTSNIITIDGLQNHKEYFFFARSTVDNTCQDWKLVLSAYPADSLERSIPFKDDFESNPYSASYGALPHDWYGYYVQSESVLKTYPTLSASSVTGGKYSAYLIGNNTGSTRTYLVTPKLKVDKLSDCYLEFRAYTSAPSSSFPDQPLPFIVGFVSDPNKIEATFEPLDTIIITPEMRANWAYFRIDLSKYTSNSKHIGFKVDANLTATIYPQYPYTVIYIDNVVVDYIPSCYEPNSFVTENITDRSIELSFTHDGAIGYEAVYAMAGLLEDLNTNAIHPSAKTLSFTGTQFKIDSLYSEVPYDVYVRALCTEQDASKWVYVGKYTTLPSLISEFPYNNDFSDAVENANWKHKRSSSRGWYMGVDVDSLVADKKNSTDNALYYSYNDGTNATSDNKSGGVNTYRYITLEAGNYQFSYDWIAPGKPRLTTSQAMFEQNLCRVLLVPSTVTMTSGTGFKTQEGRTISISYIDPLLSNIPTDWFDLSVYHTFGEKTHGALCGTDLSLPLEQQWQHQTANVTITEELAGTYMLMFLFYGGTKAEIATDGYRAAVIDNLSIVKSECPYVTDVKVDSFSTNSVSLSWNCADNTVTSYDVVVLNDKVDPNTATDAQKAYVGTASTAKTTITGLADATKYYVYVRPTCSGQYNFWANPVEFTTDLSVPTGYVFSFEEEDLVYYPSYTDGHMWEFNGDKTYNNVTTLFHKWLTRSTTSTSSMAKFSKSYAAYQPQIAQDSLRNGSLYKYGRTGKRSLWFGSRSTNIVGATVALPYAGDFENKRLVFHMRGFASYEASATVEYITNYYPGQFSSIMALDNQSRQITVGTMTDPNDATTFVPLDTVEYPYRGTDYSSSQNLKQKDPSGDKGWHRAIVSLANAKGKYIAFRYEHYGTTTALKNLHMYLDDISVEEIPECPAPEMMKIDKVGESLITISYAYEGVPTVEVEVATDENFANVVSRDTFNTNPFTVTGLQPLTEYYLRARVLCSDLDKSVYSRTIEFVTPTGVCYDSEFAEESSHYPANWLHSFNPSFENFVKGSTLTSPGVPGSGNTWGWKLKPALFANGKFASKHMVATTTTTAMTSMMWAMSPVIEMDETADQHLSFDLAITEKGNNNPVDFSMSVGDTIMTFAVVIVDTEKGYYYNREDVTLWKSTASKMNPEHDFCAITHKGSEYSIDLNKYKGKNIQVLFYYGGTQAMDIHVDNVHINKYATKEYQATTCEFCDFEDNDFFVLSSNTKLGENKFSKWQLNSENSDTLLVLNLNVTDAPETNVDAAICAGNVYNENGFTGLMQTGVYRQKFTSKNGCDSIVTLALNVVEPQHTTIIDTVCFGTTYTFAGQELNRTGMYVDSLISKVTGCDSIVTLLLTVKDVIRKDAYVNICFGDTYKFGKQTISASGTYEEVFKTVDGCDSLVTLHATVLPDYRQTINAVIKKGEEYNASGFVGLTTAGEYTLPLKSVDGCDSTVTLILKVLSDVSKEVSMNLCFGDSYTFGSQTITTSGEYVEVFKAADGGDSTVILTVTALPDLRQTIEATICAGEVYNENGFSNLKESGEYKLPLTSVDGCDSTVTLNLTVLSGDTTYIEKSISTSELPYEYQTIKYDKSTLPGTYIDTIVVKTGNCEEVIVHKLTITKAPVDVDNVSTRDLIMVPNPVAVNGTLYINAEFTTDERNGLIVEVFNAIGQCVYSDRPTVYPIEVSGLAERGMYIVRIITGDGKSYQGKIIVE